MNKKILFPSNILIYFVFFVNVILIMYPSQLSGVEVIDVLAHLAVRYMNPGILAVAVVIVIIKGANLSGGYYFPAALCTSLVMIISSAQSLNLKSLFTAIFFVIAALTIMLVTQMKGEKFQHLFLIFLLVWVVGPVVMLLNPNWWGVLISFPEKSFHGFADSRIMYGLWSAAAAVILLTKSHGYFKWNSPVLFLVLLGIYISQSRAAIVAIAAAYAYLIFNSNKLIKDKLIYYVGIVMVVVVVFGSWKLFGRQEPFELLSSTRLEITEKYMDNIFISGSSFGAGRQINIKIGGVELQAHNFLIQWIANWGYLGLLSLLIYMTSLWRMCKFCISKMLLLVLLVFSLTQPIQGTANFFGPVTLVFLLFVAMTESVWRSVRTEHSELNVVVN